MDSADEDGVTRDRVGAVTVDAATADVDAARTDGAGAVFLGIRGRVQPAATASLMARANTAFAVAHDLVHSLRLALRRSIASLSFSTRAALAVFSALVAGLLLSDCHSLLRTEKSASAVSNAR